MMGADERMRKDGVSKPMTQMTARTPYNRTLSHVAEARREWGDRVGWGKALALFLCSGVVLVPVMYVMDVGATRALALWCWGVGRAVCSYTDMSFDLAGYPMMVCGRCFGGTLGFVAAAFLYAPLIRPRVPYRRLYRAALLGLLALPWLLDSGFERLHLHTTTLWLLVPTGFLGGLALALAPLIFWPRPDHAL